MPAARRKPASPILGAASALIDEASTSLVGRDSRFHHSFEAPVDRISPDPRQARKRIDDAELRALARTMATQGQLQPILLRRDPEARDRWIIIAGERRWRAAGLNGWSTILAIEHAADPEVAALIENLQRVDLSPVEEARGLQQLIQGKGWTQSVAAETLGKSKAEVSAVLRILSLPEALLSAILTSELDLPKNVLVELARVEDPAARDRLVRLARGPGLTIRAVREAGQGGVKGSGTTPAAAPCPGRGPSVRLIESLREDLRATRAGGGNLRRAQLQALSRLRSEIDDLIRAQRAAPQRTHR